MLPLSLEHYNRIVASLYHGPFEESPWQTFLQEVFVVIEANVVSLSLRRAKDNDKGIVYITGDNISDSDIQLYSNEFASMDPFVDLPDGEAKSMEDVIPFNELKKTEYYQKFLKRVDCPKTIGIDIYQDGELSIYFRVGRGELQPAFGEIEIELLNLLGVQFRQLSQSLSQDVRLKSEHRLYESMISRFSLGLVLLDRQLNILHANPIAEHILQTKDGLQCYKNRLQLNHSPTRDQQLQQILQQLQTASFTREADASALTVPRTQQELPLNLVVRPTLPGEYTYISTTPAIAVFISAPEMRTYTQQQTLQQLFDFTPSEARLAVELANGYSLDGIAEKLSVSRNTVRTHLSKAFQKTGVSHQAALVSLILRSVASLS